MTEFEGYLNGYIDKETSGLLKERIVKHKARFKQIFKARYMEMLPSLIQYKHDKYLAIDFLKVEVALRNGYDIVIGETTRRNIQILGFAKSKLTTENPADLFSHHQMTKGDITFIIPHHLRLDHYKEISYVDDCTTGNFVVLRNKVHNYISDIEVINHYIDELAEIVISRFSISMQLKISTIFLGEVNDQGLEKLVNDIYNGNPYIKGSKLFDPDDQIYHFKNEGLAQNFQELKREYQNKISELNNMLGLNSLAVEKESGVSDAEAMSNRAFTTSNANIFLDARNDALQKLNRKYDLHIQAVYNDQVASEFETLHQIQEGEGNDNDNSNSIQRDTQ